MTPVLTFLASAIIAGAIFLLLSGRASERLGGLLLLGQGLPMLVLAVGGGAAQASAVALVVALIAFGFFLAGAGGLRASRAEAEAGEES